MGLQHVLVAIMHVSTCKAGTRSTPMPLHSMSGDHLTCSGVTLTAPVSLVSEERLPGNAFPGRGGRSGVHKGR